MVHRSEKSEETQMIYNELNAGDKGKDKRIAE